jgi:LmbE family N-acetylglucosaminyl deacetylase
LDVVVVRPVAHIRYDYTDGELALKLVEMIEYLELQLRNVSAVITHPYEGGHPDHDACAFAVQYAARRLKKAGHAAPARLELLAVSQFIAWRYALAVVSDATSPKSAKANNRGEHPLDMLAISSISTWRKPQHPL